MLKRTLLPWRLRFTAITKTVILVEQPPGFSKLLCDPCDSSTRAYKAYFLSVLGVFIRYCYTH